MPKEKFKDLYFRNTLPFVYEQEGGAVMAIYPIDLDRCYVEMIGLDLGPRVTASTILEVKKAYASVGWVADYFEDGYSGGSDSATMIDLSDSPSASEQEPACTCRFLRDGHDPECPYVLWKQRQREKK